MKKQALDPTKTVLTITVGFILLFLVFQELTLVTVASVIGLGGLLSPGLSRLINRGWEKLTWLLSLIVPNILLSIVFYFILFPVAILSRLFGKRDPLLLRKGNSTIFKENRRVFDAASMENPW